MCVSICDCVSLLLCMWLCVPVYFNASWKNPKLKAFQRDFSDYQLFMSKNLKWTNLSSSERFFNLVSPSLHLIPLSLPMFPVILLLTPRK